MARKLSDLEVHNVKLLICEGHSQIDVARALDISQGSVSRICLGDSHRDVPWPNPAVGEKLMRPRGRRSEQDQVQAQLTTGVPVLPLPEPTQVVQATESEAIEQARQQAANREEWKKEIRRRAAIVEKEMDEEYLKDITTVGEHENVDVKIMPTAWEVKFIPWEEVLEIAGGNSIVKAITEDGDYEIERRAVGIVFHSLKEEEWDAEQTPRMVAAVAEQLEEAKG
ncbi:hypothetical protein LCGC14_1849420 [marine sediment metagenome]|uniref:Uncharacterized protein n=1 Tax=marine sediment metagenome TaxID=412755 RepID=A0A0F9JA41_9ZZZZ